MPETHNPEDFILDPDKFLWSVRNINEIMSLQEHVEQIKKILQILALRPNPCLQCPLAIRDAEGGVYTAITGDAICGICNRGTWEIGDRSIEIDGESIPICRECESKIESMLKQRI